eukprot:m.383047 g.383047  ORF g.383047 m.383047 type:complete len:75 (+) comp121235_c0_seq1:42-266(+)
MVAVKQASQLNLTKRMTDYIAWNKTTKLFTLRGYTAHRSFLLHDWINSNWADQWDISKVTMIDRYNTAQETVPC